MTTVFERLLKRAVLTDTIVGPVQTELERAARLGDSIAPLEMFQVTRFLW